MTTQTDGAAGYIHTFTPEEQQRLVDQALFLEPYHHTQINFSKAQAVLEVGCGVGAQISVLLRRWPDAKITGVEPSTTQIERARVLLAKDLAGGNVALHQAPGDQLPFPDNSFDGAVVFWVFEHVPHAVPIMRDILRVLKPGAAFYVTEVFDKALHVHPACPAMMRYFAAFMTLQAAFGGDPNVGVRIPGLMAQAGFTRIVPTDVSPTLDARMADPVARDAFLDYFQTLLLSGASPLLSGGHITPALVEDVKADFARLRRNPDAVFSYGAKQTWGYKPG